MRLWLRVPVTDKRLRLTIVLFLALSLMFGLAGCGGGGGKMPAAGAPAAPVDAGTVGQALPPGSAGTGQEAAGAQSGQDATREASQEPAQGATQEPSREPSQEPTQGATQAPTQSGPVGGVPAPGDGAEQPRVSWYQKAPGYPLVTDDPAAREQKVAMLTFDDGPRPGTTEKILDALKAENVKAIFFVTGYSAKNEELLRRIAAEGHIIGTHTMSHENLRDKSKEEQRAEIVGVNEMVERVTGYRVRYFRPPFGAYNADTLALMEELGLVLINWSHGSRDWVGLENGWKDPALVVRDVLAETPPDAQATRLHPGAIILLHDTHPHTAEALPEILDGLREKGYQLVTLEP